MSRLDEAFEAFMTIMNPRGINLDPDALQFAEKIRELSAEEASQILGKLKAGQRIDPHEIEVLEAIFHAAHNVANQTGKITIPVNEVISASKDGFKVPYLQTQFRRWKNRPDTPSGATPEDFLRAQEARAAAGTGDTKLMRVLNSLLGESFDYTKSAARTTQRSDRWPTFRLLYRRIDNAGDTASEFAGRFGTRAEIQNGIDDALTHIDDVIDRFPDQADDLSDALQYFRDLPDGQELMAGLVEKLLCKYSDDGALSGLTEAAAKKLIGKRADSAQQVIDEVVMSHLILFRELGTMKNANGMKLPPEELFEYFMRVDGAEGFFETVLRRSGYEHGYVFEQLLTFNVLDKAIDDALKAMGDGASVAQRQSAINDAVDRLVLQSRINDQCGPDLIIVNIVDGKMVATVVQAKSYRQLRNLLRISLTGGGMAEATGDVVSQTRKDIRRLLERGGMNQAADGTENIGLSSYSGVFHSKIDWNRLQRERFQIDELALKTAVGSDLPIDKILSSRDPQISAKVRQFFKTQHLQPLADSANEAVSRIANELADEAKLMDLATFRHRYPAPVSGPAAFANAKVWKAIQDGEPPSKIKSEFKKYYEAFFNLEPGGAVQVEFELVDALIDQNVAQAVVL